MVVQGSLKRRGTFREIGSIYVGKKAGWCAVRVTIETCNHTEGEVKIRYESNYQILRRQTCVDCGRERTAALKRERARKGVMYTSVVRTEYWTTPHVPMMCEQIPHTEEVNVIQCIIQTCHGIITARRSEMCMKAFVPGSLLGRVDKTLR